MDALTRPGAARVLAVDDDPLALRTIAHVLARIGVVSVTGCNSGPAALEVLDGAGEPVDVIVLDLNMPGMDGIEFIRRLVARRYAGGIVLLSGEDESTLQSAETLLRAHKLRALGHLRKPVEPGQLAVLLDLWRPIGEVVATVSIPAYSAADVQRAIDGRELVAHFQPQVAVATGQVVGVEALVRWQHPRDGLVYPDRFIAVAEAHGLIDRLTDAVLGQAVAQARAWRVAGLDLRIAINLSMQTLSELDFPDRLQGLIDSAGVAPADLVLEVTESRLMVDPSAALDVLTRLRMRRFRLSIDDFGTGHSSLAQLRDVPVDELKVDRGFVHGAAENPRLAAIFAASQGLARQLGLDFVAEGVDDDADWQFLRRSGCDYAQGYFIARPMPAERLAQWFESWLPRRRMLCP
jgi:EAL domain-containing protein (putative c-di-GMP-specific phosphodiesterase class I)/ActR/RegA family two-component response regulator